VDEVVVVSVLLVVVDVVSGVVVVLDVVVLDVVVEVLVVVLDVDVLVVLLDEVIEAGRSDAVTVTIFVAVTTTTRYDIIKGVNVLILINMAFARI